MKTKKDELPEDVIRRARGSDDDILAENKKLRIALLNIRQHLPDKKLGAYCDEQRAIIDNALKGGE